MAIKTKRPPMKETVGAQYLCFNTMDTDGRWTSTFAEEVEKTEVVKSVKVTENGEASDTYASGTVYDSDISTTSTDIEVEVVAFPADTLAKLRGDNVDADGLILSGGNRPRPYFAYGKVVKLRKGGYRYDWYPKCKLSENSDDISTSEEKANEQTDTIKIKAYPFNEDGDIVARVERVINKEALSEDENMEAAAKLIYIILRSNGLKVDEDEALILTPMDPEVIRELFDEFGKKVDKYKKKEATKKNQPQTRKRKKKKSK